MIVRTQRGDRRFSAPLYKLLLTAHIMASVGWLGIVIAKLALGVAATKTGDSGLAGALYAAIAVIDGIFPPAAIATLISGVVLGLGTKWGVIQYTWILVKLVLTVAVPVTAVRLNDQLLLQARSASAASVTDAGLLQSLTLPSSGLFWMTVAHLLMLGAATVISVYKPWGKTWFARRSEGRARLSASLRA